MLVLLSPGVSVAARRALAAPVAATAVRRLGQLSNPRRSWNSSLKGAPLGSSGLHPMMMNDRPSEMRERYSIKVSAQSDAAGGPADNPHPLTNVLLAVAVACFGAFAFGYHVGIVNGPLETIARDLGFAGNSALEGAVVSSTLAGAAVGSLSGGGLADALGRRKAFLLAAIPMVLGPLLCAAAPSFAHVAAGRLLTGVAIGLSSALVPTYISEVAPTHLRGSLGTLNQLVICIGILGALCVNVLMPVTAWRSFFMLGVIPGALLALGMLRAPESPRWLASVGETKVAAEVATQLWGSKAAAVEITDAVTSGKTESGGGSWIDLLSQPGVTRGVLLFAIQQFAGINALVYFSTSVFRQAGVTSDTLASLGVGLVNVLGTIIAANIIEKAGRKQLLVGSYLGQGAAMFLIAAGFTLPALREAAPILAVAGTLLYILAFALGAGPVTGLIIPELNQDKVRGRAVAAAMTSHWLCNVAVGQTFMSAVQQYGLSTVYTAFGSVALLGALYVTRQVPETKGKSFEQIAGEMTKTK